MLKKLTKTLEVLFLPLRLLLVFLIASLLVILTVKKHQYSNNLIYVFGLSRIWRGITNPMFYLSDILHYVVFRHRNGLEEDSDIPINTNIISVPISPLGDFMLMWHFYRFRPKSSEVYFHISFFSSFIVIMISRLFSVNVVSVCTGAELLHYEKRNIISKLAINLSLKMSSVVLLKEPYMIDIINKYKIVHSRKCHEITNGVFERP